MLEAQPTAGKTLDEAEIASSVDIIRNRIDKLGVSEPEVRKQGENQIVIQLAGVFDINRAGGDHRQDGAAPALRPAGEPGPGCLAHSRWVPARVADALLDPQRRNGQENGGEGKPAAWYLFDKDNQRIAGPKPTRQEILDGRALIGKQKVRVQSL